MTLDRRIHELSKGNRQKLGIVLAFMHRPELLVLDEPTSGLDPLMQDEFHRLLRETTADGRTVFLSSHELDEVQRVADRVAIIKAGTARRHRHRRSGCAGRRRRRSSCASNDPVAASRVRVARRRAARRPPRTIASRCRPPDELARLLRVIADHDPIDVVARHADLDELFLSYYREDARRRCRLTSSRSTCTTAAAR